MDVVGAKKRTPFPGKRKGEGDHMSESSKLAPAVAAGPQLKSAYASQPASGSRKPEKLIQYVGIPMTKPRADGKGLTF